MRHRHAHRQWLFAWLALVWPAVADGAGLYRTVETESLRIAIDSEWVQRMAPGYIPIRFDITNLGDARVIEIAGQSRQLRSVLGGGPSRYTSRQSTFTLRQTIRLARGDRVRLTMSVPVFAESENLEITIHEGDRLIERLGFSSFQSAAPALLTSALIVADPAGAFGQVAPGWSRALPAWSPAGSRGPTPLVVAPGGAYTVVGPAGGTYPVVGPGGRPAPGVKWDFVLDPRRLPASWLGFTSVRTVILGPVEWKAMDDPQRTAVLAWVASGGDLIFVDGGLQTVFPDGLSPAVDPGGTTAGYFFGQIHLLRSDAITTAGLESVLAALPSNGDSLALPANRSADWSQVFDRGFRLTIPGVGGVPARAYLFILILFSVLIGPVNYLLLRRRRQQALLVLTAPIISAAFILLLVGYVVAGEGFAVHGRAVTFTMLDQVRKQASTRATVSLYAAGMTPSGGVRFPRDVAVFPLDAGEQGGGLERVVLDLSDSQRFASGLVRARSPANFETVSFRPARERLRLVHEGDRLAVVNGLGATVTSLRYRSHDKTMTIAGPLRAGERATLIDAPPGDWPPAPGQPSTLRFQHILERQPAQSYLAVLERSPFWDAGVSSLDERGSFHVVFGSVEPEP